MPKFIVYYSQCYRIEVDADDADEAESIAIGTPLDDWDSDGEEMRSEVNE